MGKILEHFLYGFKKAFILLKSVFMFYKAHMVILRYKRTYNTWFQFEILLFATLNIMVLCLLCYEFIYHNLNLLFFIYIINSFMKTLSSYFLQIKTLNALYTNHFKRGLLGVMIIRTFGIVAIFLTAIFPDHGLRCEPYVYPPQLMFIYGYDFLTSFVDLMLAFMIPSSVIGYELNLDHACDGKPQEYLDESIIVEDEVSIIQQETNAPDQFVMLSFKSKTQLLDNSITPQSLAKRDLEFWRYVRMQMFWFTIVGLFCGIYQVLLGSIGLVVINWDFMKVIVDLKCEKGISHHFAVWNAMNMGAEIFITLHVVIIMFYWTLYYIVFFVIPFRFNRIKKTSKEIKKEKAMRQKRMQEEEERERKENQAEELLKVYMVEDFQSDLLNSSQENKDRAPSKESSKPQKINEETTILSQQQSQQHNQSQ